MYIYVFIFASLLTSRLDNFGKDSPAAVGESPVDAWAVHCRAQPGLGPLVPALLLLRLCTGTQESGVLQQLNSKTLDDGPGTLYAGWSSSLSFRVAGQSHSNFMASAASSQQPPSSFTVYTWAFKGCQPLCTRDCRVSRQPPAQKTLYPDKGSAGALLNCG